MRWDLGTEESLAPPLTPPPWTRAATARHNSASLVAALLDNHVARLHNFRKRGQGLFLALLGKRHIGQEMMPGQSPAPSEPVRW